MDEFAEINITPFTDVLLVLLVVFMVLAALVAPAGFERQLPCHCLGDMVRAHPPFEASVVVDRAGIMRLNGAKISDAALYQGLRALHTAHAKIRLSLDADQTTPYARIMRIFDASKDAAIDDVSLVTR
jgi:biopolymer transport protein ExbD